MIINILSNPALVGVVGLLALWLAFRIVERKSGRK